MQISQTVSVFHNLLLPEPDCWLVGYSALLSAYKLKVPLPYKLSALGKQHKKYEADRWFIYSPRYKPQDTLSGHLTFALKYEGIDLAILHALFKVIPSEDLEEWIASEPLGQYSRRIWFLYEWLTDKKLKLNDATTGNFVDIVDEDQQFSGSIEISRRHRVRNNLPGVKEFCPMVRKTKKLKHYIALKLDQLVIDKIMDVPKDIISRAASFLLLQDSRASFEIEKEHPPQNRIERWGQAIGEAGRHPLSIEEIERLQTILIEDKRFVFLGLRGEGGFIGTHDRVTYLPIPDHISADANDLLSLMNGLIEANNRFIKPGSIDPIVLTSMIAFGFVYIHPFIDGNGRLHRYLIHHILAEQKFSPTNIIFPISAVLLDRIHEYRQVLEAFSKPRLKFIDWRPTESGNVEVLNDTIDLYRYFDATRETEFLYECVLQTIESTLPEEIEYLKKYDRMKAAITERLDMPDYLIDLLIHFLRQNQGLLSKRARSKEFSALTEQEVKEIQEWYAEIFKVSA